jgi:hypothetical protein
MMTFGRESWGEGYMYIYREMESGGVGVACRPFLFARAWPWVALALARGGARPPLARVPYLARKAPPLPTQTTGYAIAKETANVPLSLRELTASLIIRRKGGIDAGFPGCYLEDIGTTHRRYGHD